MAHCDCKHCGASMWKENCCERKTKTDIWFKAKKDAYEEARNKFEGQIKELANKILEKSGVENPWVKCNNCNSWEYYCKCKADQ